MSSVIDICKKNTKKLFHCFGYDISAIQNSQEQWIKAMDIKTILDIGANVGQFATYIHKLIPEAMIYSFEPIEGCYNELLKKMKSSNKFKGFNFGLGESKGNVKFYMNTYTPGSSILQTTDLCKKAFPCTAETGNQEIWVDRLDNLKDQIDIVDNLLIKIDVQGYEDKVIKGGHEMISRANVLILETSFQELYTGQPLFEDIYDLLKNKFTYMGSLGNVRLNKVDCSPLFADSIFINKK